MPCMQKLIHALRARLRIRANRGASAASGMWCQKGTCSLHRLVHVCACERERERERVCVCVCVRAHAREVVRVVDSETCERVLSACYYDGHQENVQSFPPPDRCLVSERGGEEG